MNRFKLNIIAISLGIASLVILMALAALCFIGNSSFTNTDTGVNYEVIIDANLKGDFSFTEKFAWPWYIEKDKKGKFFSPISDEPLAADDTVPRFFTAWCITDHRRGAEFPIRYCNASLSGDTLHLNFKEDAGELNENVETIIVKDIVRTSFHCKYVMHKRGEKYSFTILSQNIVLSNKSFSVGEKIKGKIKITFREDFSLPRQKPSSKEYYFEGLFETVVKTINTNQD